MQINNIKKSQQVYNNTTVEEKTKKDIKESNTVNPAVSDVKPSSDLLKAYVGVKQPLVSGKSVDTTKTSSYEKSQDEKKSEEMSAYDYLLTLPNVNQTFKNELADVAKVMEKMDVESSNVEMMVNLVADGKLWRGVLRYFCDNGKMTQNAEKDIDLVYGAYADGVEPINRYVPTHSSIESGLLETEVGNTFEVEGEKNIFIKDENGDAHQLKVSKELFGELFPPVERFAGTQGAAGDCYLLATLNTLMECPEKRAIIYDMFEETENSVNVKMPNGEYTFTVPKSDLRQGIDKWKHIQGATGMVLAEHTYGEELKYKFEKQFHSQMQSEISRLEKEEPENIEKIEGYKQRLADFDEKNKDEKFLPVITRFENPNADGKLTFQTDENGIMFKDITTANKDVHRKLLTQADYYRGSIGGDLDVVLKDFGLQDVQEFSLKNPEQEAQIKNFLFSDKAKEYIFTAGALSDGTLVEKPIAKDYSVYGCHAYRIAPFTDKNGDTKFYVENPWNATQNSIMDYDKLREYFEVICAAK